MDARWLFASTILSLAAGCGEVPDIVDDPTTVGFVVTRGVRVEAACLDRVDTGQEPAILAADDPGALPWNHVHKLTADLIAAERDLKRQTELASLGEGRRSQEIAEDEYRQAAAKLAKTLERLACPSTSTLLARPVRVIPP
jgi:hypothetical protein